MRSKRRSMRFPRDDKVAYIPQIPAIWPPDMAKPLPEFGHIGFDAVDALVEPGKADAEKIRNFVSH